MIQAHEDSISEDLFKAYILSHVYDIISCWLDLQCLPANINSLGMKSKSRSSNSWHSLENSFLFIFIWNISISLQ